MLIDRYRQLRESLTNTQKKLIEDTKALLEHISPLLDEEIQERYAISGDDFYRLYKSTEDLESALLNLSFEEADLRENDNPDLSVYLSRVRHDLSNWLNIIKGYSELILEVLENKQDEALIDQLLHIGRMANKIHVLVSDIKIPLSDTTQTASKNLNFSWLMAVENNPYHPDQMDSRYPEFKKQISILIVDDFKEDCEILQRYLLRLGFENVNIETNALKALERLNHQQVDLLLLDIEMPELNGVEMLLRMKEQIIKQQLMVLIISAYDSMENVTTCIKMGAIDFLAKPFDTVMLQVRMESCIQKQWFIHQMHHYQKQLEVEKKKYEKLLYNVFPPTIVKELAETNHVTPRIYENVAVLCTDVVGFTAYCENHSLAEICSALQCYAEICEKAAINHNIQKVKTVGDCFIGVSGMLTTSETPVLDCIKCALEIAKESQLMEEQWRVHSGIDFGSLIGSVVGHRQFLFDIWGDVVNTSVRVLTCAEMDEICLTKEAWKQIKDVYESISKGKLVFKGKTKGLEIFQIVTSESGLKKRKNK